MAYQRVYEVGLLDDLHNYFPAILYEAERFTTVPQLLGYIRQNTLRRFNLFDYGRSQYVPENTFVPSTTPVQSTPIPPVRMPSSTSVFNQLFETELLESSDFRSLFPILRVLLPTTYGSGQPLPRTSRFNDVIVSASQDLIDSASSLRTLEADTDTQCSICQDIMLQGEQIRTLRACSHEFHHACIDNWLLRRSVLCPMCRHDIRENNPSVDARQPPITRQR
jgi:hypothetical protein